MGGGWRSDAVYCSALSRVVFIVAGGASASLLAVLAGICNVVGKASSMYSKHRTTADLRPARPPRTQPGLVEAHFASGIFHE